jgi:hypothetical protein
LAKKGFSIYFARSTLILFQRLVDVLVDYPKAYKHYLN